MMTDKHINNDTIFIPADEDETDYNRFPMSYLHLVELPAQGGPHLYNIRCRDWDFKLDTLYEDSTDLSAMREELDYLRMNLMVRGLFRDEESRADTMLMLEVLRENRRTADEAAPGAFEPARYHDDPIAPTEDDAEDFGRFPISYAHLVVLEGEGGARLYAVRCRGMDGELGLLRGPANDLSVMREEIEYLRMNLLSRRKIGIAEADEPTLRALEALRAKLGIVDEARTCEPVDAPRSS